MTEQSIPYIKSRFETGDRPNGQDFTDLIDTLAAATEKLGIETNNNISNEVTVTGIENQTVIDSFNASEWRFVKYMVALTSRVENKHYATEITILIDNNNINVSEYGSLDNDGDVGTVNVSKINGVIELIVIPNIETKPVTVRFNRTGLKA